MTKVLQRTLTKLTFINLPMLLLSSAGFVLLCFSNIGRSHNGTNIFVSILGGIEIKDYGGSLPLLELSKWLLILSIFLLNVGNYIENEVEAMQLYAFLRYRSYKRWWIHIINNITVLATIYIVFGFLIIGVFGQIVSSKKNIESTSIIHGLTLQVLWLGITLFVHFLFLGVLLLAATLVTRKYILSFTGTMIIECSTLVWGILAPQNSKYLLGIWGMYIRSKGFSTKDGVSVTIIIGVQVLLILVFSYMVIHKMKRN